jgi:type 1 fimbria pilin
MIAKTTSTGHVRTLGSVTFAVLAWLVVIAAPASAANMTVSPSSVATGGTVTVSGVVPVPGCSVPGTVTLVSGAFVGLNAVPEPTGTGSVNVPVDASGHFSAPVTLKLGVTPGTYGVLGRCRQGELGGPFPNLTVTGLARTGGSIGPLSDAAATGIGLALVATGFALALLAMRWRS